MLHTDPTVLLTTGSVGVMKTSCVLWGGGELTPDHTIYDSDKGWFDGYRQLAVWINNHDRWALEFKFLRRYATWQLPLPRKSILPACTLCASRVLCSSSPIFNWSCSLSFFDSQICEFVHSMNFFLFLNPKLNILSVILILEHDLIFNKI